jgi:sigma-B regulation protein RsbU (phosphoserine phosphatase)
MPVGMIEDAAFSISEIQLVPGDKILIYSDGVSEAQDQQGNFFGRKRLLEVVAAHAAENCATIHAKVQEAVAAFTEGAAQSDDITVVVLEFYGKRTPPTMF